MNKLCFLLLPLLLATAAPAATRDWKPAKVDVVSATDVSGKLIGEKNTIHYAIETADTIYFADFTYKPNHNGQRAPTISVTEPTKVAIQGHSAYVLDLAGNEVKMHITRKSKK